jgi:hypothetical protein
MRPTITWNTFHLWTESILVVILYLCEEKFYTYSAVKSTYQII